MSLYESVLKDQTDLKTVNYQFYEGKNVPKANIGTVSHLQTW